MSNYRLKTVKLSSIYANPYRNLISLNQTKVEALCRSIRDTGFWGPTIFVREREGRYEQAFGHHRIAALRQLSVDGAMVTVTVADMTDRQMIEYMGRENMEDYATNFRVLLDTLLAERGGVKKGKQIQPVTKSGQHGGQILQDIEIASLLGWTRERPRKSNRSDEYMTPAAEACASASKLLEEGHIDREKLSDLTVRDARELCQAAATSIAQLKNAAKRTGRKDYEIAPAIRRVATATATVAKQTAEGKIAKADIRARLDIETYAELQKSKKLAPDLSKALIEPLATRIYEYLETDSMASKLADIVSVLQQGLVEDIDVIQALGRVDLALMHLSERSERWREILARAISKNKVVHLKEVK